MDFAYGILVGFTAGFAAGLVVVAVKYAQIVSDLKTSVDYLISRGDAK